MDMLYKMYVSYKTLKIVHFVQFVQNTKFCTNSSLREEIPLLSVILDEERQGQAPIEDPGSLAFRLCLSSLYVFTNLLTRFVVSFCHPRPRSGIQGRCFTDEEKPKTLDPRLKMSRMTGEGIEADRRSRWPLIQLGRMRGRTPRLCTPDPSSGPHQRVESSRPRRCSGMAASGSRRVA